MATRSERARAFASSEGAKTAAQLFAYVVGLVLVAAGVIGFAYDSSFDTGQGIDGDKVLGILEVDGIHNLVHIGSGLLLLLAAPKRVSTATRATLWTSSGSRFGPAGHPRDRVRHPRFGRAEKPWDFPYTLEASRPLVDRVSRARHRADASGGPRLRERRRHGLGGAAA